jgi:hypothetical protein
LEAWDQPLQSQWDLVITPQLNRPDLPRQHAYTLKPGHPTPGWPTLLRPPIALDSGTGILTCFPSATLLSLALGADSPCADERCAGNLGLPANGLFTRFIATHVSIRTSDTSSIPHRTPSQAYGTLLYHVRLNSAACSSTLHAFRLVPTTPVSRGFGFGLGRAARLTCCAS